MSNTSLANDFNINYLTPEMVDGLTIGYGAGESEVMMNQSLQWTKAHLHIKQTYGSNYSRLPYQIQNMMLHLQLTL